MATQIHEQKILPHTQGKIFLNTSFEFVLDETDTFPKPLLVVLSRLLKIIVEQIYEKYSKTVTIHELTHSLRDGVSPIGRVAFFIIAEKNFSDFMNEITRLFPFGESYYKFILYKKNQIIDSPIATELLKSVKSKFIQESLSDPELVEAYEKILLICQKMEMKEAGMLPQLPFEETVEFLFTFLEKEENGGIPRERIRSKSREHTFLWRRMWIAAILKEMYGKKVPSAKIGEVVSADPKDHASVLHNLIRHKELLDERKDYANPFYDLRNALVFFK